MPAVDIEVVERLLREAMARGQRPFLEITSGSMRPFLRVGDAVQVAQVAAAELEVGDIVVLVDGKSLLTHRLRRMDGGKLITRGDALLAFDRPFRPDELLGKVVARRREGDVLSLESGRGMRLNQKLAKIAARKEKRVELIENPLLIKVWHRLYFLEALLVNLR